MINSHICFVLSLHCQISTKCIFASKTKLSIIGSTDVTIPMSKIIWSTKQIKNTKNATAVETQWEFVPGNWNSQLRIFTFSKKKKKHIHTYFTFLRTDLWNILSLFKEYPIQHLYLFENKLTLHYLVKLPLPVGFSLWRIFLLNLKLQKTWINERNYRISLSTSKV